MMYVFVNNTKVAVYSLKKRIFGKLFYRSDRWRNVPEKNFNYKIDDSKLRVVMQSLNN